MRLLAFLLIFLGWLPVVISQGQPSDWQLFLQARQRNDFPDALEVLQRLDSQQNRGRDAIGDYPDFFLLKNAQNSLFPLKRIDLLRLLEVQSSLARRDTSWWKEQFATAIYFAGLDPQILVETGREVLAKTPIINLPPAYLMAWVQALISLPANLKPDLPGRINDFRLLDRHLWLLERRYPHRVREFRNAGRRLAGWIDLPPCDQMVLQLSRDLDILLAQRLGNCPEDSLRLALARRLAGSPRQYDQRTAADELATQGELSQAVEIWKELAGKNPPGRQKAADLLLVAEAYRALRSFRTSRLYALQAADADPSWGEPYLFLAELIENSAPFCDFTERQRKALNWLIIDYLDQAYSRQPDLATVVIPRIAALKKQLLTAEELQYLGFREGDSFPIPCWIGETVRVRY